VRCLLGVDPFKLSNGADHGHADRTAVSDPFHRQFISRAEGGPKRLSLAFQESRAVVVSRVVV
jgi:hypothetical protein